MLHHYITKYEEDGQHKAVAWLQIDLLRWHFCLAKRYLAL